MYPPLSLAAAPAPERGDDQGGAILGGLPAYFMASFYPHLEIETSGGDAAGAGATGLMDRALVASRNHREAERRRRERIKSHLDRLRSILGCDPKTDKASLLAKVVERMRDLKQRADDLAAEARFFPTETDEIVVLPSADAARGGGRAPAFQASVCCDDRSDLLPELIDTLRSLRLKTLRAEIATLGGRLRSVLILAKENDDDDDEEGGGDDDGCGGGAFLRDALKALVDRPLSGDRCKRRRLVVDRSSS